MTRQPNPEPLPAESALELEETLIDPLSDEPRHVIYVMTIVSALCALQSCLFLQVIAVPAYVWMLWGARSRHIW